MSGREERLRETFDALAAIGRRLDASLQEDASFFPVKPDVAGSPDSETMKTLDAFLQRFEQMLDHLLRKLFPRLQAAISGDDELLPIRELFDNLHRAAVIKDVETWRELIEVRNRLTHEYALDPQERAEALNDAWTRAPYLLKQLDHARLYVTQHRLTGVHRDGQ